MKIIGKNIRAARKKLKLTQKQLAFKVGDTEGAVSHWEVGRKQIPCEKLFTVAEILGVSAGALVDPNYKPGEQDIVVEDAAHSALIKKALHVLQAGSHFTVSLEQNIESFYIGVIKENTPSSPSSPDQIKDIARKEARDEVARMLINHQLDIGKIDPFMKTGELAPKPPRKKEKEGL